MTQVVPNNTVINQELNEDQVIFCRRSINLETFFDVKNFADLSNSVLNQINIKDQNVQALVLVCSRDLSVQIHRQMKRIAEPMHIKVHLCVGGTSVRDDAMALREGAHVVVGTVGRVRDMMTRNCLLTYSINILVMYGFRPMIGKNIKDATSIILKSLPEEVQRGQCFCTCTLTRSQRKLEEFLEELYINITNKVIYDDQMRRDVQTPESGVDAGEGLQEQQMDTNKDECDRESIDAVRKFDFLSSVINSIDSKERTVQMLVVAPRREQLEEIYEYLRNSLTNTDVSIHASIGETNIRDDEYVLKNGAQVLLATPQRSDVLMKRKILAAERIKVMVLDKSDELFSAGFRAQMRMIVDTLSDNVQVVLLSGKTILNSLDYSHEDIHHASNRRSTLDKGFLNHMRHINIRVCRDKTEVLCVQNFGCSHQLTEESKKLEILCDLYPKLAAKKAVIICRGKKKAMSLHEILLKKGFTVSCLATVEHARRKGELAKFESTPYCVLIASAEMAVFINDLQISVILNFDVPTRVKSYRRIVGWSEIGLENRTVINLVETKREESAMQTVRLEYGIAIEEVSHPLEITL